MIALLIGLVTNLVVKAARPYLNTADPRSAEALADTA